MRDTDGGSAATSTTPTPEEGRMHYERHYAALTREEADARAIEDTREYLTEKQWRTLMLMFEEGADIHTINFGLAIAGVSGYPFHALCRKYALDRYREWMHEGDDAVMTDEQGFTLPE